MANTKAKIEERRLARMRQGQATCSYVSLISDPEIRVAIVPLTEAEYEQVLELVASIECPGQCCRICCTGSEKRSGNSRSRNS